MKPGWYVIYDDHLERMDIINVIDDEWHNTRGCYGPVSELKQPYNGPYNIEELFASPKTDLAWALGEMFRNPGKIYDAGVVDLDYKYRWLQGRFQVTYDGKIWHSHVAFYPCEYQSLCWRACC